MRLVLGRPAEAGLNYDILDVECEVESNNPKSIRDVEYGCERALRPLADAPTGYSGAVFFGKVDICTSDKRTFTIFLFDTAFVLNEPVGSDATFFHSWTLAKSIDDLLVQAGHKGLSSDRFDGLAGIRRIRMEEQRYRRSH